MGKWDNSPVDIQFGTFTPFYLLSLSYGIFHDAAQKRTFTSLDAYLGNAMLLHQEDRKRVVFAPNGYIAHRNLTEILTRASELGEEVIVEDWENQLQSVLSNGAWLKYTQNTAIQKLLLSTKDRKIIDRSRPDDVTYCIGDDGTGKNIHGLVLEEIRDRLRNELDLSLPSAN
jgi:predicted NAD-dependent protein-ADP-ribosyltransferase YbiA (DUF1768 family)